MIDPQEIQYRQRPDNFVDGWAYNTAMLPNRYSYQNLCFGAMSAIRAANNFRPRLYAMPDQSAFGTTGITPFTDYTTQVRMLPGTQVLGITIGFITFSSSPVITPFNMENAYYVNVMDDSTGIPFFSDWLSEVMFNIPVLYTDATVTNRSVYVPKTAWLPLTRPRPILAPGIVTMTFSYKGNAAGAIRISPQVVLICAEPCETTINEECE